MNLFIESINLDLWEIVENSPHSLHTTKPDDTILSLPRKLWTNNDRNKVQLNYRAKFLLACTLSKNDYDKITMFDTTKEI